MSTRLATRLKSESRDEVSLTSRIKRTDADKLQNEYQKLVEGLQQSNEHREDEDMLASPVLSSDMVEEAMPGNIRKAEHFIAFLRRFIEYLKVSPCEGTS